MGTNALTETVTMFINNVHVYALCSQTLYTTLPAVSRWHFVLYFWNVPCTVHHQVSTAESL